GAVEVGRRAARAADCRRGRARERRRRRMSDDDPQSKVEDKGEGSPTSTALVKRDSGPPPEMRLARSLEEAGRGTFVHIDGKGEVRSPARYKALTATAYGLSGAAVIAATAFYVGVFGPLGATVGLLFGGAFWFGLQRGRRMTKAAALIQADRL